jgi:hypothetical protein
VSVASSPLAARAKALALEAGFDIAGIASADAPAELAFFPGWVSAATPGRCAT